MAAAFNELPLALFTTLAPMGAGAFIALCIAFFSGEYTQAQLKKIDKATWLPVLVVIVGFACSFMHLASPMKAAGVFANVGTSPLSNEIMMDTVFVVIMLIYFIIALTGKMKMSVRKFFIVITTLAALAFAWSCGMAYMIPTIPSWNTAWSPIMMLGICLLGGAALGALTLALGGAYEYALSTNFKGGNGVFALIGATLATIALIAIIAQMNGMSNSTGFGIDLVNAAAPLFMTSIACMLAAAFSLLFSSNGKVMTPLVITVVAAFGIFAARLAFYMLEFSVGIVL